MMRQRSNTSPILRLTRNLICIGIAAFLILFTQNEQFCKKIIPTTNEQLETYSDIKQIAARLEEEILSGSGSFSFYTTRLDPSQIQNIKFLYRSYFWLCQLSGNNEQPSGTENND